MILRLLRHLAAPDRHPLPGEAPVPPLGRERDDAAKLVDFQQRLADFRLQIERAKVWYAKLSGWHSAVFAFSTVNSILLLYSLFVSPINGVSYGLSLVLLSLFMSTCAKRLVTLH